MTTIETITAAEIQTLRHRVGVTGETRLVNVCSRALTGDRDAMRACVAVINHHAETTAAKGGAR